RCRNSSSNCIICTTRVVICESAITALTNAVSQGHVPVNRRDFVILGVAGSAAVLGGCGGGGAAGAPTPSMGPAPPPASPPVSNPPPPAAVSPLTAGQPLADLVRLANTSTTPNVFAG